MKPDKILRQTMIELAPRVEELSGLRIPRKHGHMVHPRIKWATEPWHDGYYGFYRPEKPKSIYINAHYAANFLHSDLIRAVIAHEYTHYLQDINWSRKKWNDTYNLEKLAYEVENHFVPSEEFKLNIDECIERYKRS